jgi:phospholipid-binding lipoprotein MlaA
MKHPEDPAPRSSRLAPLALAWALGACASAPGTPANVGNNPTDPWERWNRQVFAFNDKLDEAVLKPVATTYVEVVPSLARRGVSNFFGNASDAWSAVNNFLQGKFDRGLRDVMRVGTNTLFGIFGLFDVAGELGFERYSEDFGQTLGHWGVGNGPYLVLPLFGPATLRDAAAFPLNQAASPSGAFGDRSTQYSLATLSVVSTRANLLGAGRLLEDIALDRYSFVRDAYLQRRGSQIRDGADAPPQEEERWDLPAAPAAPASAPASTPSQ